MEEEAKGQIDELDWEIINQLKINAKMKMQEIGDKVHLTGQAVSNRINKMEKMGVIKGYSVIIDPKMQPAKVIGFITVYMNRPEHAKFKRFVDGKREIVAAHRISGDGCYYLKAEADSQQCLTRLLDEISLFGTCKVSLSIDQIK